jgi:hypothetical protein
MSGQSLTESPQLSHVLSVFSVVCLPYLNRHLSKLANLNPMAATLWHIMPDGRQTPTSGPDLQERELIFCHFFR